MRKLLQSLLFLFLILDASLLNAQEGKRLLVRIDDMGFSHSANVACIETFNQGIARSVEVIVPGPWFEEAAVMLNEHPDLDVGVHLALTSEWKNLKWRPLTNAPSLVDTDGYFYPMIWKNERLPEGSFLAEADWNIEEVERELRAQIEMAIKKIPHVSHVSGHMGCTNLSDETKALVQKLVKEYNLEVSPEEHKLQRAPRWSGNELSPEEKEANFIKMLGELNPGTYMTVEHPAYDDDEMSTVGHVGYENVAEDREGVTRVLTSDVVKNAIKKYGVELISYKDLR